jgi:hypothetical protein
VVVLAPSLSRRPRVPLLSAFELEPVAKQPPPPPPRRSEGITRPTQAQKLCSVAVATPQPVRQPGLPTGPPSKRCLANQARMPPPLTDLAAGVKRILRTFPELATAGEKP